MPAIRDWSFNYGTVTTATTITCPLPAFEANDLLLAVVSTDTGTTQAWTALAALTGAASEDSPSDPVADTTDANNSTANDMELVPASPGTGDGYYFGYSKRFSALRVNVGTNGVATWTITWKYYNGSTWANLANVSDGSNGWRAGTGNREITFDLPSDWQTTTVVSVSAYWVKAEITAFTSMTTRPLGTQAFIHNWRQRFSQSNTANLAVMYRIADADESDPTFTYSIAETANAAILAIRDVDIATPIDNNAQANMTAARTNFPNTTATHNNSLVVRCWSHASTATALPSAIEGPVTQLTSKDGSAHADGFAWGFMPTSGTTPTIVCSITGTTYTGIMSTIVINPPSGGATVIPTYCAADASVYVDPIHGVTAYNGNTAWAGTALTYWATPLAGLTLANATAAAQTDRGINSYRSTGGMTGPATATSTWFGATLVLATANRPDVTGKNVLLHTMPLIPADIQTVDGANLGRGIAVGMASSAGNGKTWHVHGAGTPFGVGRAPVVINSGNTTGVIDTRGTFNASSVLVFGCFTSGFLVSSDWHWTMIWILDTTTIAGGNAAEPVDITGIRIAAADGHERMSVIQQASNQLLVLQPLQFGDGGTSPTYLDLNATAIEFPEIYNKIKRQVYYCSVANVAGITYYAGASDTIKHRNSVISSASKYHWKFHASTSTSATYDFSGLSVIGAGTVTLVNNLSLSGVTWSSCDGFASAGAYLDECFIENTTGTSALTVSSATNMSRVTNCTFTDNNNGDIGHSIELTATGTYAFNNIAFSGGGVAERNFNTGTGVNSSTEIVTVDEAHGYSSGDAVYYQDQGGSVNMGLTDGTLYYVNAQTSTTLSFHTSKANAIADTSRVNLTSSGSETHFIYSAKADVFNNSGGAITINVLNGGTTPSVRNSDGSSTTVNNAVALEVNGVKTNEEELTHGTVSGGDGNFDVGNYLRGLTSGAVGIIRKVVDSTHTQVYIVSGTFNPTEVVNETTNGTSGGDTGASATLSAKTTLYVRCRIHARPGGPLAENTQIMNEEADIGPDTDGNFSAQESFNFISNQPVVVRARYRGYLPFSTTGVITENGLTITAIWIKDPNFTAG